MPVKLPVKRPIASKIASKAARPKTIRANRLTAPNKPGHCSLKVPEATGSHYPTRKVMHEAAVYFVSPIEWNVLQ